MNIKERGRVEPPFLVPKSGPCEAYKLPRIPTVAASFLPSHNPHCSNTNMSFQDVVPTTHTATRPC
jgi:hypothetical protein